jgi:hypothetical protein
MTQSKITTPEPADTKEQSADVSSDRNAPGKPAQKPPLPINEIEDLESDVEGG